MKNSMKSRPQIQLCQARPGAETLWFVFSYDSRAKLMVVGPEMAIKNKITKGLWTYPLSFFKVAIPLSQLSQIFPKHLNQVQVQLFKQHVSRKIIKHWLNMVTVVKIQLCIRKMRNTRHFIRMKRTFSSRSTSELPIQNYPCTTKRLI